MRARWPSALAVALILGGPAALACEQGGAQGGGEGASGGDYGHGRNGDQDGRDNCHSFCGNTIVVPNPAPPTP